ncbi:hypothetical protein [Halocatena marina]|uniref:Uncharacterized protein n=1 Tax=Halocatena marina TaxID=2934937 RepID=A0ABD5YY50_9EURY|nr:hypothetical protein [Halocatena marina]
MEKESRLETTQIGNATAYYVPFEDLPSHNQPDHTCRRCGREVSEVYDFAKLDVETYFDKRGSRSDSTFFEIFCRFCYTDFLDWIHDPSAIGDYPQAHAWDIPSDQLDEVRENEDIQTTSENTEWLPDERRVLYEFVKETDNEDDQAVPEHEIIAKGEDQGRTRRQAKKALRKLKAAGLIYETAIDQYKIAI